jgi:hypothetical protein
MSATTGSPLRLPYLMHTDAVAAARVLLRHRRERRPWVLHRMLAEATCADACRRRTGRMHPRWGDGSLMAAALRRPSATEPPLSDPAWCRLVAYVYLSLAHGAAGTLPLTRSDGG